MAYLDNSTITVDAILTKTGRKLLSQGNNKFKITKFGLSDSEVDYGLWNPDHADGSSYYGEKIEHMCILEPTPNTNTLNSHLYTGPAGQTLWGKIEGIQSAYTLKPKGSITLKPYIVGQTDNIKPTFNFKTTNIATAGYNPAMIKDPANTAHTYLGYVNDISTLTISWSSFETAIHGGTNGEGVEFTINILNTQTGATAQTTITTYAALIYDGTAAE